MNYKRVFGLLLVGLIILAAMIIFIGPGEILLALEEANKLYVLLAIIIQFIIMFLWNGRWSIIASSVDIKHKQFPLFAMMLLGLTVNEITPSGRTGGEPVRAYLLSKNTGAPFKKTFATVMGDKLFDTLPFGVLAIIAILYLIFTIHLSMAITVTLIGVLILFIVLLALLIYICINEQFAFKTIKWIFRQARRFMSRNLDDYEKSSLESVTGFQKSLKLLMADRKVFSIALIISFIAWFLELIRVYVVFLAFGTPVSLGMISAVFLISTLVGMIPTLPGGVGAIDGVMILVYSIAGIPPFVSTAATLIERLISYWMVAILGLMTLPYFGTGVLDEVNLHENEQQEALKYEEELEDGN